MDYQRMMHLNVTEDTPQQQIDAVRRCAADLCDYHTPTNDHLNKMGNVRNVIREAIVQVVFNVPASPARTRAINALLEARMLANQAIIFGGAV